MAGLDKYDDLVEKQLKELEKQKQEKKRKQQKQRKEALKRWENTAEEECSCGQATKPHFKSYDVSFLRKRDEFSRNTDADELWVCEQCGRIPSTEEVTQMSLSKTQS